MTTPFDVAVVGLGPAGRALASACLGHGLRVLAIDPDPDLGWRPTYGLWADEVRRLPATAIRSRITAPQIRAHGIHTLDRTYVVLDNRATQQALALDGAEVRASRLSDEQVSGLRHEARLVFDARGARPAGRQTGGPAQTAYGIIISATDAAPALDGAPALLMDWRTDWTGAEAITGPATFLYAIPLGGDRVLLEETCLAASPAYPITQLKTRLRTRLLARGVDVGAIEEPLDREIVHIPLLGRNRAAPPGTLAIGTAGRGGNPVTGYSVAHALSTAECLAADIAHGRRISVDPIGPADGLRSAGLRALLRLGPRGTLALFDAFGALPGRHQQVYLARDSSARSVAIAMWAMFHRMPPRAQRDLIRATLV